MENEIIKDRTTFLEELMKLLKQKLKKEVQIDIQKIFKKNDTEYHAISLRRSEKSTLGSLFNLEDLYEHYKAGESIEELTDRIVRLSRQNDKLPLDGNIIMDIISYYPFMKKGHIIAKLINREMNKEYLKNCFYIPYLDLAIAFYAIVALDEDGISTVPILNHVFEGWGITKEELLEDTLNVMIKKFPVHVRTMKEIAEQLLEKIQEDGFADKMNPPELDVNLDVLESVGSILVVTNKSGIDGATVMLYPGFLKVVAETVESDRLFILPSSVHELLLLPYEAGLEEKELLQMINIVNKDILSEEVLSEHLYIYDKETDQVHIWKEKE